MVTSPTTTTALMTPRLLVPIALIVLTIGTAACGDDASNGSDALEFPTIEGVLRTPDARFENLPGYDFEPHYVELGNIRMHYVDEGPADGTPVVMLHGEPSWSYLYRDIVRSVVAAGHRAIVPDLIVFGKSDKPPSESDHTYERHITWVLGLFQRLGLKDIVLVIHDWGGPIGLRLAAENPELVRLMVVTNTFLPMNEGPSIGGVPAFVLSTIESGPISQLMQIASLTTLPQEILAAYDAPYPDDSFKAGPLAIPRIIMSISERPVPAEIDAAWDVLREWTKPVLTAHSDSDPALGAFDVVFQNEIPGAMGQPHTKITNGGHFVQEDNAEDLAQAVVDFVAANAT